MTRDQRVGLLIVVASMLAIGICLLVSDGWGYPGAVALFNPLSLFDLYRNTDSELVKESLKFLSQTRYVVAILLVPLAYGVCRFFSLFPPLSTFVSSGASKSASSPPESEH